METGLGGPGALPTLLAAAPHLTNLKHLLFNHPARGVLCIPNLLQCLHALPDPQSLLSFGFHLLITAPSLLTFMESLQNLTFLLVSPQSLREDNHALPAGFEEDPLRGITALGLKKIHIHPSSKFLMSSLSRFTFLEDLKITIASHHMPDGLVDLRLLTRLRKVDIQVPFLDRLLTSPVFDSLIRSWPNIDHFNLIDWRQTSDTPPLMALDVRSLETLAKLRPNLLHLVLSVDTASLSSLPPSPPNFKSGIYAKVCWEKELPLAVSVSVCQYFNVMFSTRGEIGTGRQMFSTVWYWKPLGP